MKKTKLFLWCFTIILFIELIVVSNPTWYLYRIFTKPLIVGSLLVFFLIQKVDKKTKVFVSLALVSTLIGDIQLIYASDLEFLFLGGLIAFLISLMFYILEFSRSRDKSINFIFPSLILSLYAGTLFWYLHDYLDGLTIPVAIYMITAGMMILFAYLRHDDMFHNGYIYILTGALLLMLSASIVAITRFKSDIMYSDVLVMGIHGVAQLCLVMGVLMSDPFYRKQKSLS